jgi:hypothetical protein
MTKSIRQLMMVLAACLAGLAMPAQGATVTASVTASVVKPLTLTKVQDLAVGTVTLNSGSWAGATVGISQQGVLSCANANTICSGTAQAAQFTVAGSNNETVRVTAPNVTLVNQANNNNTLLLTVDAPATIALPNSGTKGVIFGVGGSISLASTTANGTYSGTLNVTVDYQ